MTNRPTPSRQRSRLYPLLLTAILLSVGFVLPFLTGQIQLLGKVISPLHIPVFICGLTCGWGWGAALGIVLPILRSLIFGMPPLVPMAIPMAFEMAAYGAICGLLYPRLLRRLRSHYAAMLLSMLPAMVAGRLLGGAAKAVVMGLQGSAYSFQAFLTGYFTTTAIGALLHLLLVPLIVSALERGGLSPMMTDREK